MVSIAPAAPPGPPILGGKAFGALTVGGQGGRLSRYVKMVENTTK